jgi:ABC-type Fe3+-siderophore transport system permease subunit
LFILFLVAAVFIPATGMTFMVEGADLFFDWINFLSEKIPHIAPNWGERQTSDTPRLWPMRWTLSLTALLVQFQIGFIGATH